MPTMALMLVLSIDSYLAYSINKQYKWFLYTLVFVNTFIFPVIITLVMYQRKIISSLQLKKRSERIYPFGFAVGFYFFTYFLLKKTAIPQVLLSIILGSTLTLLAVFLITFKYKISAHMAAITGLLGALLAIFITFQANYSNAILLIALIWGFLASARLKLKAHSHSEIYGGSLVGGILVFMSVFFSWG